MRTTSRCFLVAVAVTGFTLRVGPTRADVVEPPPEDCPEGYTPMTGHGGPYCQPPPPLECPVGYEPKVYESESYCEPPPPVTCPPGSAWDSRSAADYYCRGGSVCEPSVGCGPGYTCVESSLCVTQRPLANYYMEVVSGRCTGAGDCAGAEPCVTEFRCDPLAKREPVPEALPPPQEPIVPAPGPTTTSAGSSASSGCGCRTAPARDDLAGMWGVALCALLWVRRRWRWGA